MQAELKALSLQNGLDEYGMLQDIGRQEYGFTNDVQGMPYDVYRQWLAREDGYARGVNLPAGWIAQTTYFLYIDRRPVGIGRVRHESSELLERRGVGNVGYGVARAFRGRGYGSILFAGLLDRCRALGYDAIKVFPAIENAATNRVIQKNGGILFGTLNGEKNIYRIPLR